MGIAPDSGGLGTNSFAWLDRKSSSWRTWQLSLFEGWETYSDALPKRGMMRSGLLSERSTWEPPTAGSACSSSPTFGTPTAAMKRRSAAHAKGRAPTPAEVVWPTRGKVNSRGEPKLSAQVLFPTPSATPYGSSLNGVLRHGGVTPSGSIEKPRPGAGRPSLDTMARKGTWPTPLASDGAKDPTGSLARVIQTGHPKGRLDGTIRRDWPTPRSSGIMSSMTMESAKRRVDKAGYHSNLEEAVAMEVYPEKAEGHLWPTPTAGDSKGSGSAGYSTDSGRHSGTTLTDAITRQRWATPAARDWKSGKGRQDNGHTPQLPEQVGGQLNPTWVEWLMGFPPGWTDLGVSGTASSLSAPMLSGSGSERSS